MLNPPLASSPRYDGTSASSSAVINVEDADHPYPSVVPPTGKNKKGKTPSKSSKSPIEDTPEYVKPDESKATCAEKFSWAYPEDKRMMYLMLTMYLLTLFLGLGLSAAFIYTIHFSKRGDIPVIGGIAGFSAGLSMIYAIYSQFIRNFRPLWLPIDILFMLLNILGWTTLFMLIPFGPRGFDNLIITCMIYLISFFAVGFLYQIRLLRFHKRILLIEHTVTLAISIAIAVGMGVAKLKSVFYPDILVPLLSCCAIQGAIYSLYAIRLKPKSRSNVVYSTTQLMGGMAYGFLLFVVYLIYVAFRAMFEFLFLSKADRKARQLSRFEAKQRNLPELLKDAESESEILMIRKKIEKGALEIQKRTNEIERLRKLEAERGAMKLEKENRRLESERKMQEMEHEKQKKDAIANTKKQIAAEKQAAKEAAAKSKFSNNLGAKQMQQEGVIGGKN